MPATPLTFPSLAEQCAAESFQANLTAWGRQLRTDTNEDVTAVIEDWTPIDDPEFSGRQKNPVFVTVTATAGCVNDPRAVQKFFRDHITFYKTLKFGETEGDLITWRWICEAQRKT